MNVLNIYENKDLIVENINDIDSLVKAIESGTKYEIKDSFYCGDKITTGLERIYNEKNINVIYTTEENPIITFKNSFVSTNFINKNFFLKHKDRITKAMISTFKEAKSISIIKEVYSENLLDKELQSDKKITLIDVDLSTEMLDKIKNSFLDVILFKNGKKEVLSHKYLIGYYTKKSLNNSEISISTDILNNKREFNNLEYVGENTIVTIQSITTTNTKENVKKYYEDALKIVKKIKSFNKNTQIKIKVEDKKYFDENYLEKFKECSSLIVNYDLEDFSLVSYLNLNEKLNFLIKDIKESNLSPYEKYLKIYDIVKKFKKYKESPEDKTLSRKLSSILDNEYMVCVGFSKLLLELLALVDIEAMNYSTSIYITKENQTVHEGHVRTMVNIKDEKYNINGYYIADSTWDNNLAKDEYTYAHFTFNDMKKSDLPLSLNRLDYIFDCTSFEEYCSKMNVYLNKEQLKEKSNKKALIKVVNFIMETLLKLDNELYDKLFNKYNELSKDSNENDYNEFLTIFGNEIIQKTNKVINEEKLLSAVSYIKNVDSKAFLEEYKANLKRAFPYDENWNHYKDEEKVL